MTQPLPPAPATDAPQDDVNPLRRWLMSAGALMGAGALFPNVIFAPAYADTQSLPNTVQGAAKGGVLNAVVHPEPPTLAFYLKMCIRDRTTTAPPPTCEIIRKPLDIRAQRTRINCRCANANCGRPRGHNWRPENSLP